MKGGTQLGVALALALLGQGAAAQAAPKCPQIHILLDRSASMLGPVHYGIPGPSRWNVAKDAVKTLMARFDGVVRFGFGFFGGAAVAGGERFGATEEDLCTPGINVLEPDYTRAIQIAEVLDALSPGTETPTRETLEALREYAPLLDPEYNNYILLLTDGVPNCFPTREIFDPTRPWTGAPTLLALRALGISTFIVGFDFEAWTPEGEVLNEMALAGGVPRPLPTDAIHFYRADDIEVLASVIESITGLERTGGTLAVPCSASSNAGGHADAGPPPGDAAPAAKPPAGARPDHAGAGCGCAVPGGAMTPAGCTLAALAALAAMGGWVVVRRRRAVRRCAS